MNKNRSTSFQPLEPCAACAAQNLILWLAVIEVLVAIAAIIAHLSGGWNGMAWLMVVVLLAVVAVGLLIGLWFCVPQSRNNQTVWLIGVAAGVAALLVPIVGSLLFF